MRIVVLDGFTLNPGDLSWESLCALGEVVVYDRTPVKKVVERAAGADIILTNKTPISAETIANIPSLKYIGVMATGYNIVDIQAAHKNSVIVTNVAGYSTPAVAQHVFALLLELLNKVGFYSESVRKGEWHSSVDFSYWNQSITELNGKTFGIVGFGTIGRATAKIALAFGMRVISFHKHPERDQMDGVEFCSLETLFEMSDVVSLHCPLNDQNIGFVNKELLLKMKPNAIIINTARGPLINHDDLADALTKKIIAGAGLDVYSVEPPQEVHPIFSHPNCVFTPHQAWASFEARERLMNLVVENVRAFQRNEPIHVISPK